MNVFKVGLFGALLVAVCIPAVAQRQLQLDVPFNFVAAGTPLPAGSYKVSRGVDWNQSGWRLSGAHASVLLLTSPVESHGKAHRLSLVFVRTGDSYSLVQIWPTEHLGRELRLRTKVETTILTKGDTEIESGKYVEIAAK
jgi:hypothetical protein